MVKPVVSRKLEWQREARVTTLPTADKPTNMALITSSGDPPFSFAIATWNGVYGQIRADKEYTWY
jgi:hypothetical protein